MVGALLCACPATAQTDSLAVYKEIQRRAGKYKVTRWLYEAVFVPPVSDEEPEAPNVPQRRVDRNLKFRGRIIRRIEVQVLDPFGHSVDRDTVESAMSGLQRVGNAMHRTTRQRLVRGQLLVRSGDALDPLAIAESERLLRASPAVNDARITVVPVARTRDSVDVLVLVHDRWNYDASGEGDLSSASLTFRDRNLLGWGQELEQRVFYDFGNEAAEFTGKHVVRNIRSSYISSTLSYALTPTVDQVGLSFDRPFYSPLARWAGGVAIGSTWAQGQYTDTLNNSLRTYALTPVAVDMWAARAFGLGDGLSSASRSSTVIGAARYAHTHYADGPGAEIDTLGMYVDNSLYLVSAGLSIRQYYKDRYLFRFGAAEDVPEGALISMTTGAQQRASLSTRSYLGFEVVRSANTDRFGYFSGSVGYGTYFERGAATDATTVGQFLWFSNLQERGRWRFRQFVRAWATYGSDKPLYSRLTLGGEELYGLSANVLTGTHKEVFNFELVAYAPYRLIGFRFAPVLFIGLGTIGEEADPVFSGRIHSAFSLGVLVRNENLLVKTFEITVGFYPRPPDGGPPEFRINPSISFALGARDPAFAKPSVLGY